MSAARFSTTFRDEHRQVRDYLLDLIPAFETRNTAGALDLLVRTAKLAGPHFRYEEESLYPFLIEIFGREYIEKLVADHDRVIAAARRLVGLASGQTLSNDEVAEATRLVRGILPHVSDCDGLSIMVERLPEERVAAIFDTRDRALADGLDLLTWADTIRPRRKT